MRWARWPEDFRHDNYLTVKPATIYNEIELVVRIVQPIYSSVDLVLSCSFIC